MTWPAPDFEHLLLSSRAMQQLEEALFAQGLPVAALMEQAGLGLAQAVLQHPISSATGCWCWWAPATTAVMAWWWPVNCICAGLPCGSGARSTPINHSPPSTCATPSGWAFLNWKRRRDPSDPALWLDALFGLGQQRPLGPELSQLLQARQRSGGLIWSIDGPSGLDSDTGLPTGNGTACCQRSLIVGLWKRGFWQDSAMAWVGEQQRIPLSLPTSVLPSLGRRRAWACGALICSAAAHPGRSRRWLPPSTEGAGCGCLPAAATTSVPRG